ncbi:uncharacterized protein si:ch211-142k18.1 [Electrophorus electricus]|uniref:uncharacterized protein si:ch211-142k18.1 n=1 Tax=Electrophorus electricus TaxID=8005 RepID=UPI0015D0545E|nr:uncharacterized protein si:ch211-142k18.1 [Electrophorus electricus]
MGQCWALAATLFITLLMPVQCQSGDTEDWGSGSVLEAVFNVSTPVLHTAEDDPAWFGNTYWTKPLFQLIPETTTDDCSVYFQTNQAMYRRLRAAREEVAYLKALQHGNQAVVENLVQFVGAEMGEHSYQEVIQENIAGIREDHASSEGVMKKAAEELENQLEGDFLNAQAGIQKIKEGSLAFEQMLRATADIASRLEISSRTLHMALTKQLRKTTRVLH